ncbi:Biotin synthase [Candidatus Paraburkholderia kirkii]|nr:Biotin synthase [Candidatus Paraburkholderia kirkii]
MSEQPYVDKTHIVVAGTSHGGMREAHQAQGLREAGLDYYNHNLDTSPEFYGQIISTRTYQDRLDTLEHVRDAGINVCCGGIVGMGESRRERAGLISQLANMDPYPESVPINNLVQVEGTPLTGTEALDPFEFVRTIAVTRITMPRAMVRLSAGREQMDEALQALCFAAGANSIFYGDQLLTTSNPQAEADRKLIERLGMRADTPRARAASSSCPHGGRPHRTALCPEARVARGPPFSRPLAPGSSAHSESFERFRNFRNTPAFPPPTATKE